MISGLLLITLTVFPLVLDFTLLYTMSFELPTQSLKECKAKISWIGLPCSEERKLPVARSLSLKQSLLSVRGREGRF